MKKDKILIATFLGFIFLILCCFPIQHILLMKGIISLNLTDNWQEFVPVEEHNIIDRVQNIFNSKKITLENRIMNYFPFYIPLNSFYQTLNFKGNQLLYDTYIPLKPNADGNYIFYDEKDGFYYLESKLTEEEMNEKIKSQIDFFNGLSDKGIDTYIYLPTRYEFTNLKKDNLHHYIEQMEQSLNDDIHVASMNVTSMEEYKKWFYKTDHHWTIDGALEGYHSIMNMLGLKPKEFQTKYYTERKYYGSIARSVMGDAAYDYLGDVDADLDYTVTVNGKEAPANFKPRKMDLKDYKFTEYYVQYYNGHFGEVVYDYHQEEKENLLIIGDSYVWPIDHLIASSFNKTYVIHLKYDAYKDGTLDLKQYMEEHNISKVLFVHEAETTLFDQYNYGFVKKVK